MEIATLNEILFPPFLFLVIFFFLCCQFCSMTRTVKSPVVSAVTPQFVDRLKLQGFASSLSFMKDENNCISCVQVLSSEKLLNLVPPSTKNQ